MTQAIAPFAPPAEARAYGDYLIARYAAMTNDPQGAAAHYADAMTSAPHVKGLAERAVFSALLAGDYKDAVKLARRSEAAGDESTLVRFTLGVESLARGRDEDAAHYLAEEGFGTFNRSIARGMTAWRMQRSEGTGAAVAYLNSVMTGDPRLDSTSLYMTGLLHLSEGEDEDALATFEALWASGARLAVGLDAHARLLAARGDRARADELLLKFRDEVGSNAALERLRAEIESGAVIEVHRPTVKEGAALAIYIPAAALSTRTQDDLSSVYFVLALALDPDLQEARTLWASALEKTGRREEALAILSQVPRPSPFYATARGQMAWLLRRDGRTEDALSVAGQALAEAPDRSLLVQLADLFRSVGRNGEAEHILTDVIESDADEGRKDWRLLYARGAVREQLGRWPEAETDLKAALELQPESASVLNYLGYSYIDRGIRLEEGMELIRKALALEPNSGFITDSLGWAYFQLGRYEMATRYLERAVELEPGDATLNDHLGDAYWNVGRKLEAKFQWEQALKLDVDDSDRERIEVKLLKGPDAPPVVQAGAEQDPLPQRP
ncbi:tetratricopeptide repeat protein [Hyphomonas sp.]|uniref:tetratricopeptide repeat protein n=1 Tax=Hyphomonas sp. TaxID=87 RepID=UPI0035296D81